MPPEVSNLTRKGHIAKRDRVFPTLQRDPYIRPAASFIFLQIHTQFTVLIPLPLSSLRKHTTSPLLSLRPILNTLTHTIIKSKSANPQIEKIVVCEEPTN